MSHDELKTEPSAAPAPMETLQALQSSNSQTLAMNIRKRAEADYLRAHALLAVSSTATTAESSAQERKAWIDARCHSIISGLSDDEIHRLSRPTDESTNPVAAADSNNSSSNNKLNNKSKSPNLKPAVVAAVPAPPKLFGKDQLTAEQVIAAASATMVAKAQAIVAKKDSDRALARAKKAAAAAAATEATDSERDSTKLTKKKSKTIAAAAAEPKAKRRKTAKSLASSSGDEDAQSSDSEPETAELSAGDDDENTVKKTNKTKSEPKRARRPNRSPSVIAAERQAKAEAKVKREEAKQAKLQAKADRATKAATSSKAKSAAAATAVKKGVVAIQLEPRVLEQLRHMVHSVLIQLHLAIVQSNATDAEKQAAYEALLTERLKVVVYKAFRAVNPDTSEDISHKSFYGVIDQVWKHDPSSVAPILTTHKGEIKKIVTELHEALTSDSDEEKAAVEKEMQLLVAKHLRPEVITDTIAPSTAQLALVKQSPMIAPTVAVIGVADGQLQAQAPSSPTLIPLPSHQSMAVTPGDDADDGEAEVEAEADADQDADQMADGTDENAARRTKKAKKDDALSKKLAKANAKAAQGKKTAGAGSKRKRAEPQESQEDADQEQTQDPDAQNAELLPSFEGQATD